MAPFCLLHRLTLARTTFLIRCQCNPRTNRTLLSRWLLSHPICYRVQACMHANRMPTVVTVAPFPHPQTYLSSDRLDYRHCHPFIRSFIRSFTHSYIRAYMDQPLFWGSPYTNFNLGVAASPGPATTRPPHRALWRRRRQRRCGLSFH